MSLGKEALAALLKYHDDLYYNQDNPQLSDIEYDALKNQYIKLYGEYDYVPGEASVDSIKFEHPIPVTSLDKIQVTEIDKLKSHLERLWPVIIQPKMDGLTLVSYPDNDDDILMGTTHLKHVTRGNGKIGEIVTPKVDAGVDGIGATGVAVKKAIRSEVIMLKKYLEPINKKRIEEGKEPFKNLRNAAAGMLRNKDISKVEGLKVYAYNIISEIENFCTAEQQIEILKDWNWNTVDYFKPNTIEEAIEYITTYDKKYRDNLPYEIDGLVIKHNGNKKFGQTSHHPNNAIAVKFEAEGEWTKITSVKWSVGKTGIITPIANIQPVDILGSTISKVTLHNISYINALNLRINGEVKVIKANDVIPRIIDSKISFLRNDFPIVPPKLCPVCNHPTEFKQDILFCTNNNCEEQLIRKIELLASRDALNIEGLSEATIRKMIDYNKQNNKQISFILPFLFTYEDILNLPGFAPISAKKLYNNIQKSKDTELKRFIYAANIPLIGKTASENIANTLLTYDSLIADLNNNCAIISNMSDIGPKMINNLKEYALDNFYLLKNIGINPKAINKINILDKQLTFVITGTFSIPRKEIEEMIKNNGHLVKNSVSKKTNYLLASKDEENTSKYKKAKELNINIINSLEELNNIIDMPNI